MFLAVARTGSLSGAARALGVNHATIARRLARLQDRVGGAPLLERRPEGFLLTHAGRTALQDAEGMERAALAFAQRAKDNPARAAAAIAALGDLSQKVDLLAKGHVADGAQPLLQLAKLDLPDEGQGVIAALRQQLLARQQTARDQVALDLAREDRGGERRPA